MFGFGKKLKLSVIIPVYNTKDYLRECLDSVLKATENIESEIVLVDNGSDDGSPEIIREYVDEHKRVSLIQTEGKGPGGARNIGVERAKGEYLAFVDSDDFVAPDIYENMILIADRDRCDMVVCDAIRKDGAKYIHSELHRKAYHNLRHREISVTNNPDLAIDCTVWNRLIRTSLYKKHNVRFPDATYCEDVPVVQWLYLASNKTVFIHKWGYCWRIRKESITRNYSFKHLDDEIRMLAYLKELAEKYNSGSAYLNMIDYRILALEFAGSFNLIKELPENEAHKYIDLIAEFISSTVDMGNLDKLSLYNQQKTELIMKRDIEGLLRLFNYRKINYMNAPVIENEDGYEMVLPDDIFTIESRSMKNEFNNMPYWTSIDSVDRDGDVVTVHTHIYIRRINMPECGSQKIKAFLVNDMTGAELELKVQDELRPSLTKARGTVLNYDDYRDYHYNYDGTGFSIEINAADIADDSAFNGWNFILIECENKMGRKNQVLRFGTKAAVNKINSIEIERGNSKLDFSMNEIQIFGITKRGDEKESRA